MYLRAILHAALKFSQNIPTGAVGFTLQRWPYLAIEVVYALVEIIEDRLAGAKSRGKGLVRYHVISYHIGDDELVGVVSSDNLSFECLRGVCLFVLDAGICENQSIVGQLHGIPQSAVGKRRHYLVAVFLHREIVTVDVCAFQRLYEFLSGIGFRWRIVFFARSGRVGFT